LLKNHVKQGTVSKPSTCIAVRCAQPGLFTQKGSMTKTAYCGLARPAAAVIIVIALFHGVSTREAFAQAVEER
jgi:phosphatidylserine synthase